MANPIAFKSVAVDPRVELQRRLDAAPKEHAQALLVAWDILQTAHDEGLLDTVHGLVGAKDTIFAKLAEYAKLPEGVAAIRNLLAAGKLLASLDPDMLDCLTRAVGGAMTEHKAETKVPGLWTLARRAMSEDGRRGLSLATGMLVGLGRGTKS